MFCAGHEDKIGCLVDGLVIRRNFFKHVMPTKDDAPKKSLEAQRD